MLGIIVESIKVGRALAVLLIFCLVTPECAAQVGNTQQNLAVEIRRAILDSQFSYEPQFSALNETRTILTAHDCLRNHGAETFRGALLVLLHDRDSNVRETAALATRVYGLPSGNSADAIRDMLNDSDSGVNLVGLKMASDAKLSAELVVRIALTADHPVRQEAIQSLRPFLCAQQTEAVAERAVSSLLSGDGPSDAIGATLEMLETLGPRARFAENEMVKLLRDRREYCLHTFSDVEPNDYVNVQSIRVLRMLGAVSVETRGRLYEFVNDAQNRRSIELMKDSELLLWGESAIAVAALYNDEAPIRHFIDTLMNLDNGRRKKLSYFTEETLRVSPTAIISWVNGKEIVGSMIGDRVERSFPPHWRVVSRWPQAAEVFKPRVLAYFNDEFSEAHATSFSLVCRIANEDGLTFVEAEAIVKYALQSPSDSREIRSIFLEFSRDAEAVEMLHAALSMAGVAEDSVKFRRSLELIEALQP